MPSDPLLELLVEWDERLRAGRPTSVEDLCPDDPSLREQLRVRIARRERLSKALELNVTVAEETPSPATAIPHVEGYKLLEVIGHGGMGIVYKANQLGLNRLVALKMILAGSTPTTTERARFLTEAQAAAKVSHTNIVQVHDVGEAGGRPYLAMEYLADGSLATWLQRGSLTPIAAAELLVPLADAVQHAHDQGVVHRDLKPANILLLGKPREGSSSGSKNALPFVPKIADFGLAKRLDGDVGYTQTGAVLGSPSYMPPEQAIGSTDISTPADVYGLGAVLYEMLAGRPPFRGVSFLETLDLVRHTDPIPPRTLRPSIPRDLEIICLKCLEKDPTRRYPSAAALADDLRRFLAGDEITAKADSLGSQIARLIGRSELDHRVARFGRTVAWLAPLGIVTQSIAYAGWRNSPHYVYIVLGCLVFCVTLMLTWLLFLNQEWLREVPSAHRRHHRTIWTTHTIACVLMGFVVAWSAKTEQPDELMMLLPLLVILTGTSIFAAASFAGWMYISGGVFYATAILMVFDLSLAGLEVGALMTWNVVFQTACMRRLEQRTEPVSSKSSGSVEHGRRR